MENRIPRGIKMCVPNYPPDQIFHAFAEGLGNTSFSAKTKLGEKNLTGVAWKERKIMLQRRGLEPRQGPLQLLQLRRGDL